MEHYLTTPVFESVPLAGALPAGYIERCTLVAGQTGHLYTLPAHLGFRPKSQDMTSFADFSMLETFEHHATFDVLGRKTWVFFEFSGAENANTVSEQLVHLKSDLIGVGHIADDRMVVFCRRSRTRAL